MLLLGGVAALAVLVAGTAVVSDNWDAALVALVVGLAAGADLARGLRARDFMLAGPDALVVRTRGRTTSTAWSSVEGVELRRRRWRAGRLVLLTTDGPEVTLPSQAPADQVRDWIRRSRPVDGTEDA